MKILLLIPLLALSSCATVERVITPDNIGRALIIYGEVQDIYDDVIVTPTK